MNRCIIFILTGLVLFGCEILGFPEIGFVPAFGPTVVRAGPDGSGNQNRASVPDLSGAWTKPYVGIESPASGPGPVTNRSRRNGRRDVYQYVGDYTNPILKPEVAEIVKKYGEISLTGVPYPSPRNQCWPEGIPGIFVEDAMQLIQQPGMITIIYPYDHQVRRVRMNEPHAAPLTPSWYGDSIGYYERDTLLIDTVGIKIGPFAMLDFYGTPYTDRLHVIERYQLIDDSAATEGQERGLKENAFLPGGGDAGMVADPQYKGKALQLAFTVEDERVFTVPWSATVTYRRALDTIPENVCAENLRATYVTKDSAAPRADKPDF
jgi:hypothetical protein